MFNTKLQNIFETKKYYPTHLLKMVSTKGEKYMKIFWILKLFFEFCFMNINQVKTAVKVGEIILREDDSPNLIKPKWLNPKCPSLKDSIGRVYLLVINGKIFKIGGSACKGGIKKTISGYTDCMKGGPSDRSYILHYLIYRELKKSNIVEVFMITSPKVIQPVTGLFGIENKEVSAFREMELLCVTQHYQIDNRFPVWNFQESNTEYPLDLSEQYSEFKKIREEKKKSKIKKA